MKVGTTAAVLFAAMLAGCGDDGASGGSSTTGGGGAGAGSAGGAGGSTSTETGGSTSTGFSSGGGAQGGGAQGGSCAGVVSTAEPIPLDLAIMLDASGSMTDKTGMMGQGVEKWEAITAALDTFFNTPGTVGIGVGLQFFPLIAAGVPDSCSSQADCGAFGPCVLRTCQQSGDICVTNQDCPPGGGPCTDLGQCQNNPDTLCLPIGASCPGMQGQCVLVTSSFCLEQDSCDSADYAAPAVPIATLPGVYPALDAAISGRAPEGGTPTAAALQGAIDYASSHAAANPDHVVVSVLATDGIPTSCDPTDAAGISQIAAQGLAGPPSFRTIVIGIIAGNDPGAQALLNQVAAAGGTGQAFFVDPQSQDVEQAFLDALDAIQGSALACEYFVPQPDPPDTIAYDVNVDHTLAGDTNTIGYVGDPSACDPSTGGWYYDVDPSVGTPTRIVVCPATCAAFQAGGAVEIRVGCETVVAVPR